jgi:starch-binding outer membrane protein, SusD/RagB family
MTIHSIQNKKIYLIVIACLLCSCTKMIEADLPDNLIESKQVFSNDQTAISAALGVYAQLRTTNLSIFNGGTSLYTALSSDELNNTTSSTVADPFSLNALQPTNPTVNNFWSSAYSTIYQVNSSLEGLSQSSKITDSVNRQLTGEMKFIRAFCYFNLVNLFGDVPLINSTDYRINSAQPRTATSSIYSQVITDLTDAKQLLKTTYPSANRSRANKWTASALLARIYLYTGDWVNAENEASSIINSGLYSLPVNLNNVFVTTSPETIFQVANDNANTAEGAALIPSSTTIKPTYAITSSLLNAFESNDGRKTAWLSSNTISGQPFYYPFKYKLRLSTPLNESEIVLRLAEQFLLRAEARVHLNKLTEAAADLDVIRVRAGLSPTSAMDAPSLLLAIEKERRTELFTEWGHRWFDLKRTGHTDSVLKALKGSNWQTTDILYPLPQTQLDLNPKLMQNPGY